MVETEAIMELVEGAALEGAEALEQAGTTTTIRGTIGERRRVMVVD